jgi:hypothetical protein
MDVINPRLLSSLLCSLSIAGLKLPFWNIPSCDWGDEAAVRRDELSYFFSTLVERRRGWGDERRMRARPKMINAWVCPFFLFSKFLLLFASLAVPTHKYFTDFY